MKIELKRYPETHSLNHLINSVSGSLYVSGIRLCHTEEHPGTALPAGEYRIVRHYCKQYARFMPIIIPNSPNHQHTNSPNHQITNSPNHQITNSPNHQITNSLNHQITNSLNHQITNSLNHQLTNSLNHQLTNSSCEGCEQLELVSNNTSMPKQCPMLKPGNGVYHRADGSIILGTRIVPGCLSHPLQAFMPLAERIRKALSRGTVVTLKITEQ